MKAKKSPPAASLNASPPAEIADPYRAVVEDLTETICRFLPDGTFTFVNDVFCRFLGKSREELIGHPWHELVGDGDLAMIASRLSKITPSSPVVYIENQLKNAQGQLRWMQFSNRGYFDKSGSLIEILAVGRDVTERVLAEQSLEESRLRWKFAVESSGFGIWDWDVSTGECYFSSQWKTMLGYDAEEKINTTFAGWRTMLHPDDLPSTIPLLEAHLAGHTKSFYAEFRMLCKDGTYRWILSRGSVIQRDAQGKALRMTGTHSDITKRRQAEDREAHNLKLIVEGAPVSEVLAAIVRNVEAGHPGMRCSVMLVDSRSAQLHIAASPSMPEYVRKALDGMPIAPNVGVCGVATYTGHRVVCPDVLSEKRLAPFHKLAAKAKLLACWSEPIISSSGKVLGAFASYHREVHEPGRSEIQAITTAARLASLAIEREQREQTLKTNEERYARAMRGTTDGLWDWNVLTGETYLSPRWKEMLGFSEDELPSNRQEAFLSRLHPDDFIKIQMARQRHFETREPYQVEFRLRTKDDHYKWFVARGQAEWNEQGQAVRLTGTIADITERIEAQTALQESENRFRAIFEQAAVGVGVIDTATGRYLSVNQRMCEIKMRPREEMLKLTFMDVTYPADLAADLHQMEELKAGLIQSFNMEKRIITPTGETKWINLTVSPMWQPGSPPLRHIAVIEDITERKQTELNYRRELAYNQALVNNTSAFITVLDVEGRFVHANPAFFSTMGYTEKEVLGKKPWEFGLMDAEETLRSKERLERLLRGEDNPPRDARLRTKSGEIRAVELRSTSTRKPDGSPDRIVITGTDMTERNHLQKEVLRVVEQEQARVGHDLHDGVGQTMTGIVIMMEALEADLTGEPKALAHRIHELTQESVSEVRRMSHGLSPTSVKYRGLIGALHLLAETVRTNFRTPCTCDIDSHFSLQNEEMETHLFRIAQEAVNNALRHGKPKLVTITLAQVTPEEAELCIRDDGEGMKKTKPDASSPKKGNGIGVRVMDYRANLIGGRLTVKTQNRRGVAVSCKFPCPKAK